MAFNSNGLDAISPFVTRMDTALRTFGFDLKAWISTLDIATVGMVMLAAAVGFIVYDLIAYKLAGYTGNSANYHSYGRSLLSGAAEAWQNRNDLGLDPYFSGIRGRTIDANNVSNVLNAISKAVLDYETPILSTAASTTHNTITHPKFPSAAAAAAAAAAPATQGRPAEWGWN